MDGFFIEHGYEVTSFNDLEREAGLLRGSLYRIFSSKRTMFELFLKEYLKYKPNSDMTVDLLQLKRIFTSYRLNNIMSLGGYYSIRFYEFFIKWERTGKRRVSLNHLKILLGISQKSYEPYGNLKNRVIRPSIKELNKETNLNIKQINMLQKILDFYCMF